MNNARIEALERGITGVARKVLEACPIAESWDAAQVSAELRRTSISVDHRTVTGCLRSLASSGLLRETERGKFIRVNTKAKAGQSPAVSAPAAEPPTTAEPAPEGRDQQGDAIDKIGAIVAGLRGIAETATELASSIEDVVLDIELSNQAARADSEKLRQLQNLLRGTGT